MKSRLLVLTCLLILSACDHSVSQDGKPFPSPSSKSIAPIDAQAATSPPEIADGQVVLAAYNVENFLRMDRWVDGKKVADSPKPEKEVQALMRVLADISPHVLVISEIGGKSDFAEFRARLAEQGMDYQHTEHLEAADRNRHLALLSKFPIVARNSQAQLSFILHGNREYMQRGILDVTLQLTPDYQLRVLGAHLKSKRPVPQGEALIRRNEALLLRKHIDSILANNPNVNLILAGDLNDTKNEPTIQAIMGSPKSPDFMADIWLRDYLGDRWTHFWKAADIYSRIDFAMVNRALFREIDKQNSYIYRSPYVLEASDHRPLVVVITPQDR